MMNNNRFYNEMHEKAKKQMKPPLSVEIMSSAHENVA